METTIWNKTGGPRGDNGKRLRWSGKGAAQVVAVSLSLLGLAAVLSAALPRPASAEAELAGTAEPRLQEISTADAKTAETEAGNLVADAVRSTAGADIAFVPAAAFKPGASAPRSANPAQVSGLVEPSSDMIVVLNLKGDQVLAALERSVSFAPQPSAAFLQVSGVSFAFDPKKESQNRVSGVTVGGKALDKNATYKVAVTRPLGNGQQGYHQVWSRNSVASDTGKTLAAAISEYAAKQGGSLSGRTDGRIKSL